MLTFGIVEKDNKFTGVVHSGKFIVYETQACLEKQAAINLAKAWIKAKETNTPFIEPITLDVQNMVIDPDTLFNKIRR